MEITILNTLFTLFIGLFTWEFIAKKKNTSFKPSAALSWAATKLSNFFRWIGEKIAIISSFYTYLNLKEMWRTCKALDTAKLKLVISPRMIVSGYIKKMSSYGDKSAHIIFGSLTLACLLMAMVKFLLWSWIIQMYTIYLIPIGHNICANYVSYGLMILKRYAIVYVTLFIIEYVARWRQSNFKPSVLIRYIASIFENVYECVGSTFAILSSFYTYIDFEWLKRIFNDIIETVNDLVKPMLNFILSPLWIFIGYVKTMDTYKRKYLIIFGSITLALVLIIGSYWLISYMQWIPLEYAFPTTFAYAKTGFNNTITFISDRFNQYVAEIEANRERLRLHRL